jgi:hypothetical protein
MRQIKRYKCRLGLKNRVREDEVRCFRITLDMSAFPPCFGAIGFLT